LENEGSIFFVGDGDSTLLSGNYMSLDITMVSSFCVHTYQESYFV